MVVYFFRLHNTTVQSQKAVHVTACSLSKQLLPFGITEQNNESNELMDDSVSVAVG